MQRWTKRFEHLLLNYDIKRLVYFKIDTKQTGFIERKNKV